MPLPKPKDDESKEKFMDRCLSNPTVNEDFPDNKQRYAVCLSAWSRKSYNLPIEKRIIDTTEVSIEKRDNGQAIIIGHAALFDVIGDGGWFRETINKGAFKKSIKKDDIRALINHREDYVLGRTTSGTLKLHEDDKGLAVEIYPPDTQYARDLIQLIERRDISQMSFAFNAIKDTWQRGDKKEADLRILEEVKLFDVSAVTYPFYPDTDLALRSFQNWENENFSKQFNHVAILRRKLKYR